MAPSSTARPSCRRGMPGVAPAAPGAGSKTRPRWSTTPSITLSPMAQPPSGCTVNSGPSGSPRSSRMPSGKAFQSGLGSTRSISGDARASRSRASCWVPSAARSRSRGQSIRRPPSPSRSTSAPAPAAEGTSSRRPSAASWPISATGSMRSRRAGSTACGSDAAARCGAPSHRSRSCNVAAVAKVSPKTWRSAPGTARSWITQRSGASRRSIMAVMVGPMRRVPAAADASSSATAPTRASRPWTEASMSPLVEKRWPSRSDSGRPARRERSRISVDPRAPAASTTRRARSRKGRPWRRRSCASVCCTITTQPSGSVSASAGAPAGGGGRSSRSTVAPVWSATPGTWQACASSPTSSEILAFWLQPVAQSPQPTQADRGTPATVRVPGRKATVRGTGRAAPSMRPRAAVLSSPADAVPATVLGAAAVPAPSQPPTVS